jgi:hypothetical protein
MCHFFEIEKNESSCSYALNIVIPKIEQLITENKTPNSEQIELLTNSISDLQNFPAFRALNPIKSNSINNLQKKEIQSWLENLKLTLTSQLSILNAEKDSKMNLLIKETGSLSQFLEFKKKYQNEKTAEMVTSEGQLNPVIVIKGHLVRNIAPVYYISQSKTGRSHFYASEKMIGDKQLSTFIFNNIIIWLIIASTLSALLIFHK